MKRSKKILFIIIPSLVVFFALSFLLTSTRQEELEIDKEKINQISISSSTNKSAKDDAYNKINELKEKLNNNESGGNRKEVECGGVTINLTGLHDAPGSAWLNKCLAYSDWDCSGSLDGPEIGGCKATELKVGWASQEGVKSEGIVLVQWECPAINTFCAKKIEYALPDDKSESFQCELCNSWELTCTATGKDEKCLSYESVCNDTKKVNETISYCDSSRPHVDGGSATSRVCFYDTTTEAKIEKKLSEKKYSHTNLKASDITFNRCSSAIASRNCAASAGECPGSKFPAVPAEASPKEDSSATNCCGNLCIGCDRECTKKGPSEEGIDGEQFTASSGKGNIDAYCVNQHLMMPENGKFMWDSTFNVTACKDSNSSKDCGYGYILLKSYALGYDYKVTNAALRLWAASDAHGRAAGYDNTPGVPLSKSRGFVEKHYNVYVQTAKEINLRRYIAYENSSKEDFRNDIYKGSYKTVKKITDLKGIMCSSLDPWNNPEEDMGVFCTSDKGYTGTYEDGDEYEKDLSHGERNEHNSEEYLKSIYLYILALQGNKIPIDEVYRKHLSNKCKTDSSFKSKNKELCANPDEATIDVGDYTNRNYIPVSAKVTYIDPESFETTIKFTMSEEVDVECSADELATANYCKTNVEITDSNGNVVKADHYDECKKNICYIKVKGMKTCNKDTVGQTKKITIKVITDKVYGDLAVKKMVACDSPGSNQIFFALDLDNALTNTGDPKVDQVDETEQTVTITCPCEPTNKCMNDDIIDRLNRKNTKSNLNATCETKDGGTGEYDTYEDNSLEDPNMNCIINMCYDGQQSQYDYSEKYGVNNKYCTLYCRDEVRFYLANKTKVYTGMQFRYDVGTKLKNKGIIKQQIDTNDVKYLTSVVRQERHCTSVIDYKTWKADYDKASSLDKEQLIYDIENCNLYDIDKINVKKYYEDAKVIENGNSRTGYTTVDYIKKTLKCQMDASGEDSCADLELEYKSKYNGDGTNTFAKDEGQVISEVKYCSGSECYQYKCPSKAKDYNTRLKECNEWSKTTQAEFDPDGENITTIINGVAVPKNDYAAIVISSEVDFSNPIKYQTKAFTGDVKRVENDKVEDMYTPLGKNVYPVELNQRTFVNNPNDEENWKFVKHYYKFRLLVDRPNRAMEKYLGLLGNEQGHQFDYNYTCNFDVYNKSTDYNCDPEANYNKCYEISDDGVVTFHESFKDENGNEVACSKECVQSGGYGFVFRNVQLDNMFPSEAVRDTGNNWTTNKAKEAIKEIEASADKMYTTDDYLEYSYTITPEAIKSIKDYNKQEESSGGYQNSTLYGCESSKTNVSAFENCKSKFLEEISKDESVLGMNITAHKSDGISKYTQNKNKTKINAGE